MTKIVMNHTASSQSTSECVNVTKEPPKCAFRLSSASIDVDRPAGLCRPWGATNNVYYEQCEQCPSRKPICPSANQRGCKHPQTHTTKVHERHRVTPLGWDKQLTVHSVTTSLATHRRRLHVWCSVERQIDLIDSTHLSGCLTPSCTPSQVPSSRGIKAQGRGSVPQKRA